MKKPLYSGFFYSYSQPDRALIHSLISAAPSSWIIVRPKYGILYSGSFVVMR